MKNNVLIEWLAALLVFFVIWVLFYCIFSWSFGDALSSIQLVVTSGFVSFFVLLLLNLTSMLSEIYDKLNGNGEN